MLIRFSSPAHHDVLMFGGVAHQLLAMMGMSGQVPSAAQAEDLPAIRVRLLAALARVPESAVARHEDDDTERETDHVPLRIRALPLLELLEAAAERGKHVMWEEVT